ncbi:hypothetical protein A9K55_003808 [Cordyceps militaris]|uniref:Uncharacterized protein n=1 Tax=Cordyceps militaris TaxID=73501 RepID=A0A2H4SM91_CORMI|nr:hypothetical protein A9K55_003808 [Cordyceps militaris]
MRSLLFLLVLFELVCFSSAELRHAYENIVAFLGYRAELLLLPESQRIIGVKCVAADPDTHKCLDHNPKYTACKGTAKVKGYGGEKITDACSLREFLSHITGGKQYLKTDPLTGEAKNYRNERLLGAEVGENALYFDVDYAARQMGIAQIGFKSAEVWCKIKDGAKYYEGSVQQLGRRLAALKGLVSQEEIEKTRVLFDRIDAAVAGIVTDRRCGISEYLIPQLEAKNIKPLVTESISGNRRLFKEDDTIRAIKSAWEGKPDADKEIKKALAKLEAAIKDFNYSQVAADHKRVVELWETFAPQQATVEGCTPRTEAV